MKIDGNRPTNDTQSTDSARRTGKDAGLRQNAAVSPSSTSSDRVELSGDAALRAAAFKAASDAPAIRTELVDRMREKLNAGKVGNDAGALADAIIDDLAKCPNRAATSPSAPHRCVRRWRKSPRR
jgi:flagellar biosynthesis anti-sigma factor FlgM